MGDHYRILVTHQLASRLLRESIAKEFKAFLGPELDNVEDPELYKAVEEEAEAFETLFFKEMNRVSGTDVPVFDFEIN